MNRNIQINLEPSSVYLRAGPHRCAPIFSSSFLVSYFINHYPLLYSQACVHQILTFPLGRGYVSANAPSFPSMMRGVIFHRIINSHFLVPYNSSTTK